MPLSSPIIEYTDKKTLLALLHCDGIGGQTALRLAFYANRTSISCPYHIPFNKFFRSLTQREKGLLEQLKQDTLISDETWFWVEEQFEQHRRLGAHILGFFDDEFPLLYRLMPNPPPLLFVLGNLPSLEQPRVAVVGTRSPSLSGIERVQRCTALLSQSNVGIISGLALGVDTLAHQTALKQKGYTAALIGTSLDLVYPRKQVTLQEQILDRKGAIISEQPLSTPVNAHSLVSRDRLQAGLATATYVIESRSNGGALHTARAALAQQRPLWFPRSLRTQLDEFRTKTLDHEQLVWLRDKHHFSSHIQTLSQKHDQLIHQAQEVSQWIKSVINSTQESLKLL